MDRPSTNQGLDALWPWTWPLGDDVTQRIGTWWINRSMIRLASSTPTTSAPAIPRSSGASSKMLPGYGRQLGRIMEALDVVIGHLRLGERKDLTAK